MRTSPQNSICPSCRQRAPIMLRGMEARCTACGARRQPFGSQSLTFAGKPARVGGAVATVAGWIVLVLGLSLTLFFGVMLQTVWPGSMMGLAFAIPAAVITLLVGVLLLVWGRRLKRRGVDAQRVAQLDAVRAVVAHRGGSVTAEDVANALQVSEEESDALLTELAKDPRHSVSIDVDDEGRIHYAFGVPERRWRVLEEQAARREAMNEPVALEDEAVSNEAVSNERRARH